MKITKHAQSCFLIETGKGRVLVDPGSYVFNEEGMKPEEFQNIDLMLFTHEHFDHFDLENVRKIIEANRSKIIATKAVCDQLKEIDIEATEAKAEESHDFSGYKVTVYKSTHGPLPTGAEPPQVMGYKIESEGKSIYTPGDTVKLAETGADVVAVPICGQVVLDIEQAKAELIRVGAKTAIPIHYDNPRFPVNVDDFITAMQDTDIETKKLNWGESVEI